MLLTPPERAEPTPAVRAAALLERVKAQSGESKAGEELWANPLVAAGADRVVHALKTTTERRSDAELQGVYANACRADVCHAPAISSP